MVKANVHLFNFIAMSSPIWIYVINQKQNFKHMNRRGQDQDITIQQIESPHCSDFHQKNHSTHICWGRKIVSGQCISYTAMTSGAA